MSSNLIQTGYILWVVITTNCQRFRQLSGGKLQILRSSGPYYHGADDTLAYQIIHMTVETLAG